MTRSEVKGSKGQILLPNAVRPCCLQLRRTSFPLGLTRFSPEFFFLGRGNRHHFYEAESIKSASSLPDRHASLEPAFRAELTEHIWSRRGMDRVQVTDNERAT